MSGLTAAKAGATRQAVTPPARGCLHQVLKGHPAQLQLTCIACTSLQSLVSHCCLTQQLWRMQATACPAHLQCLQHSSLRQVLHHLQEALWLFLWGGPHHTCEVVALGARKDAACWAILTAWAGQLYVGRRVLSQHVGPQRGQQHLQSIGSTL